MLNRLSPQGAPSMSRFLCDSPEVASACSVHGTTPTAASASLRGSIPSRTAQNTSHLFSHTGKEFPVSTDEEERLLRSPLSTLTPLRSNQLPTQRRHARWSSTCKRHSAACPAAPRTRRLLQPPAHVPPAPPLPANPGFCTEAAGGAGHPETALLRGGGFCGLWVPPRPPGSGSGTARTASHACDSQVTPRPVPRPLTLSHLTFPLIKTHLPDTKHGWRKFYRMHPVLC